MAAQATAQKVTGLELPAPGTWEFDRSHSSVTFVARHLVVAKVRGRFATFSGAITIGETPETSSVTVMMDAAGIDTGDETRDAHLRSPDFLDVETYPSLQYRSTRVERTGETSLRVDGALTIRDVTRPVSLDVTYLGLVTDPFGSSHAIFSAVAEIDREGWGVSWNKALESGGVLVGRHVKIELEIEAIRKP